MEAAIARTGGTRSSPYHHGRKRHGTQQGWRAALVRDGRMKQLVWCLLAIGLAVASASGYVHTYPPAIELPPAIGGKNVPHLMVQQRQYVADELYAMERRAVRAANRLDRVSPNAPLPESAVRDLQSLARRFAATGHAMDAAMRKRIARALARVRQAAGGGDPIATQKALRDLQVKLAVARHTN